MKVVYLLDENINHPSGVIKKINAQIEEWVKYDVEVYILSIATTNNIGVNPCITPKAKFAKTFNSTKLKLKGIYFNMWNKIASTNAILKTINEISPDVIYLREMIALPGLVKIVSKFPTILEANTLFLNEAKLGNPLRWYLIKLLQPHLYKHIDGFISVTNEISNQFLNFSADILTIANGISFEKKAQTSIIKTHNLRPQVVFVGTPGMPWHGVDLYYKMAELILEADFHLIGPTVNQDTLLPNFFSHGYLQPEQLSEVYSKMDIAVGSLALFRNNMKEACVLKVREYLKFGLPVIIGYSDVDINDFPFILKIENSENGVIKEIDDIRQFILNMKGFVVPQNLIEPVISSQVKEETRIKFVKRIISK